MAAIYNIGPGDHVGEHQIVIFFPFFHMSLGRRQDDMEQEDERGVIRMLGVLFNCSPLGLGSKVLY
jgi:hypothetical protein